MNRRIHRLAVIIVCILMQPTEWGAEPAKVTDGEMRIRGIFESALPGTEGRKSLRLTVHPHLGDLRERDYLRTVLGFRYGLTTDWEVTVEADWYASHGMKEVAFLREQGFSSWHLGSKYRLGELGKSGWNYSVGADWVRPVGSPPPSVTDGLQHVAPYVTFSRQLKRWPDWRVFFGATYDFVAPTDIAGEFSKNQLTDDSAGVSGGLLWARGPVSYALECSYATMHVTVDSTRDIVTLRPGLVWVVPPAYTFGSRGKWLLGFALRISEGADGLDVGASAKVRVNFDFKRLLGRKATGPKNDAPRPKPD
jgi:hypothetical protein